MKKYNLFLLVFFLLCVPMVVWLIQKNRPLPRDISYKGRMYRGDYVFLRDLTYRDKMGHKKVEQEIFKEIFKAIEEAEDFILIDMFLFNDDYSRKEDVSYPTLSENLTQALIKAHKSKPNLKILFITDPINGFYGSYFPGQLKRMEEEGISVVETDLRQIKDSNPLYSNFYRAYLQWIPRSKKGHLPNLFNEKKPKATLPAYLSLLNFKANHRKVFATEKRAIVTSANPHDGSFFHSNIAISVTGPIIEDIIQSEKAVLAISGANTDQIHSFKARESKEGEAKIQLLTEGKIQDKIIESLKEARAGYEIQIGLFYLSDRHVIKALKEAGERGAKIQLILDQNKDAFGKKKIGIPNKPVAKELEKEENIEIRWYKTQGEQFHAKFLIIKGAKKIQFIGGSANFTRRNLDDLNLETDLYVEAPLDHPQSQRILAYYQRIWTNEGGDYTEAYEKYGEDKWWKEAIYWIQEFTGMSTF